MVYGDFKDVARRTASDKVLRYQAFNIAKNLKYDGYQRGLASVVYKLFDKTTSGGVIDMPQELKKFINQLLKNLKKKALFII